MNVGQIKGRALAFEAKGRLQDAQGQDVDGLAQRVVTGYLADIGNKDFGALNEAQQFLCRASATPLERMLGEALSAAAFQVTKGGAFDSVARAYASVPAFQAGEEATEKASVSLLVDQMKAAAGPAKDRARDVGVQFLNDLTTTSKSQFLPWLKAADELMASDGADVLLGQHMIAFMDHALDGMKRTPEHARQLARTGFFDGA